MQDEPVRVRAVLDAHVEAAAEAELVDAVGMPRGGVGPLPETNALAVDAAAGLLYSASGDGNAYAWDLKTHSRVRAYEGHTDLLHCLALCPQRRQLFSGSEDGRVLAWRLVEGAVAITLRAHKRAVCSLACHPTESCVLAASHDGTVSVWDRSEAPQTAAD